MRAPKPLPRVIRLENPYESLGPQEYDKLHSSALNRTEYSYIQDDEMTRNPPPPAEFQKVYSVFMYRGSCNEFGNGSINQ